VRSYCGDTLKNRIGRKTYFDKSKSKIVYNIIIIILIAIITCNQQTLIVHTKVHIIYCKYKFEDIGVTL